MNVRKGLAWKALQSLDVFWQFDMSRKIKTKIFRTAIEPGAETSTLKKADIRALDGVYTRMLRRVFGVSWESHTPNTVLYGNITSVTDTIKTRRLRSAGHVHRLQDQPAQELFFWQPSYGRRYQGRHHKMSYKKIRGWMLVRCVDSCVIEINGLGRWHETRSSLHEWIDLSK